MTAEIISFDFQHNHTIRTAMINGVPWFVAADVCAVLGYANPRDAVAKHVRAGQRADVAIHDGRQNRFMVAVSEGGLYRLIMRSDMPRADEFQDWVTDQVLPSIRKTGRYEVAPSSVAPTALEAVEAMVRALRAEHDRNDQQDGRLDGQDGRLDGLDERVETLDGRMHAIESAPPSDWMTVNVYAARTENSPNSRDYLNRLGITAARVCDEGDVQPHRSGPAIHYPRWSLDRAAERLRTPDHRRPAVPTLSLDEARKRSDHKKITGQFTLFDASPGDQPF